MACLEAGRALGFLGPMPVDDQIDHAMGMALVVREAPVRVVDLGSGGGIPSLVLARHVWPDAEWHLIESNTRRAAFLRDSLAALGLEPRAVVHHARAEEAGRDPALRHAVDAVTARSFAAPGVTAECAAPFLMVGGLAVVSEPPEDAVGERWPADGLAGLDLVVHARQSTPIHAVALRATGLCADRYPRRVGIPAKRPLF